MSDNALAFTPAHQLKRMILTKQISVQETTSYFLNRINAKNSELNAFLFIDTHDALACANKVDEMIAKGDASKPLLGLPVVFPDVLAMHNTPMTFGSLIFDNYISQEDAIEIETLKESGTIILGKTNLAEFGLSYDTTNRLRDACRNPWNLKYSPGGGLGGAAVAVAAGLSPFALSTDFMGALRMCSSFCGLPGIMPTRGRIANVRKHLLPFTERMFYRKGVTARCIRDIAMMLNVLAKPDKRDPMCCCEISGDYEKNLSQPSHKLKIAWSPNLDFLPVQKEVVDVVSQGAMQLEAMGHIVEEVKLGFESDLFTHFQHLFSADRYVLLMKHLHANPNKYDLLMDSTKEWLRLGNKVTGAQYSIGITYMSLIENKISTFLQKYDIILTPTVPASPFPIGHPPHIISSKFIHPYLGLWSLLVPFNMSGHPAFTIPCGTSPTGLPIGMQLVGRYFSEGLLLSLAHSYEQAHPFAILKDED